MEERHRRLLVRQNPWWSGEKTELPEFERDLVKDLLKHLKYKQIIAVVGLRRVGKTVLMKQIIRKLDAPRNNVCYMSFDDIDFQKYEMAEELIGYFLEFSDKNKRRYLFLDEIQKLPNWADLLKTYYDVEENLKIFISGSASLEIKKHKETLAGRILTFHLPILTFREFVRYSGMEWETSANLFREYDLKFAAKKERYKKLFEDYLVKGAFPELLEIKDEEFIRKYVKESVVEKVISDVSKITGEDEKTIHELFRLMVNSDAQLFEIINLASILKINRNLVSRYVNLLEKAFLIKISYNFTTSVSKQIRVSKKQYCAHSSIVIALLDYPFDVINTEITGHMVESTIANNVDKSSFWRTPQNEVDIVLRINDNILPIEVKYKTQLDKKDVKSLLRFMEEFKVKKGFVITKDTIKREKMDDKELIFIPAWLFLLTTHSRIS